MIQRTCRSLAICDIFTPTTWAVEAYSGLFWRNDPLTELVVPVALLLAAGLGGLALARVFARRLERV